MPLRCAKRFESHTPQSLPIQKTVLRYLYENPSCYARILVILPSKLPWCWTAMPKNHMVCDIERCEMRAIRTLAAGLRCETTSNLGWAMQTTNVLSLFGFLFAGDYVFDGVSIPFFWRQVGGLLFISCFWAFSGSSHSNFEPLQARATFSFHLF